jgi:hypothetical protein
MNATSALSALGVILSMQTIDLTYVGRGIHEELIAYVADQEGYFEDEGVHVAIRDGIRWENERLRAGATIGLGRSLLTRMTGGIPWKVLSVNTHRPLFWFLAVVYRVSGLSIRKCLLQSTLRHGIRIH